MHVFHCPELEGSVATLPETEAHHARAVLRLKPGAPVVLVDGRGTRATGTLLSVDKHSCTAQVDARVHVPPGREAGIHLAVAPTKQVERFEWFLEKATEVGIGRITPLLTERVERHRLRTDRLEKVLVAAMKQSQRAWLPQLDEPTLLDDLLRDPLPGQRLFGWCEGERVPLTERFDPATPALMVIGPEGDLSPREATRLNEAGFTAVSLGEARLRTETAALVACTWMALAPGQR